MSWRKKDWWIGIKVMAVGVRAGNVTPSHDYLYGLETVYPRPVFSADRVWGDVTGLVGRIDTLTDEAGTVSLALIADRRRAMASWAGEAFADNSIPFQH